MAILRLIKKNFLNIAIVVCFVTMVKLAHNYYEVKSSSVAHSTALRNIKQVVIKQNIREDDLRTIIDTSLLSSEVSSSGNDDSLSLTKSPGNNDLSRTETLNSNDDVILDIVTSLHENNDDMSTEIMTHTPPTLIKNDQSTHYLHDNAQGNHGNALSYYGNNNDDVIAPQHNIRTFGNSWLVLWFSLRCISLNPYTLMLMVAHCVPHSPHLFSLLPTGELLYNTLSSNHLTPTYQSANQHASSPHDINQSGPLCVIEHPELKPLLMLGPCNNAVKFNLTTSFYLQTTEPQPSVVMGIKLRGTARCMSPVTDKNVTIANKKSCLHSPIALTDCTAPSSRIKVVTHGEMREFKRELTNARGEETSKCTFPACRLNVPVPSIVMTTTSSPCRTVADCVTVLTKTAKRPHLVTRLAESIRSIRGEDLKIISYDDGPDELGDQAWEKIREYPKLEYIVGPAEDMGISVGRNLALELVTTPYFLLVDDDHVFTNKTNIEKMIDILERTDASIVGGKFENYSKFGGRILFGNYLKAQTLSLFSGLCDRNLTEFPGCEQCDSTSNIFLAKTQDIRDIGGWTAELKVTEHTDFFVKMKAAQKKVVYCDDIEVANRQEKQKGIYHNLRYGKERKDNMVSILMARYNINGFYWCSKWSSDFDPPTCRSYKQKEVHC